MVKIIIEGIQKRVASRGHGSTWTEGNCRDQWENTSSKKISRGKKGWVRLIKQTRKDNTPCATILAYERRRIMWTNNFILNIYPDPERATEKKKQGEESYHKFWTAWGWRNG